MKELKDMTKEELLEVIRIKDILIKELREEMDAYQALADDLQRKLKNGTSCDAKRISDEV